MKRYVWYGFLALLVPVLVGNAMDNESREKPTFSSFVPSVFRNNAQTYVTAEAIDSKDDPSNALDQAVKLVRRRPIPAQSLLLLSLANHGVGDEAQSARALTIAAERGWRVAPLQAAMVTSALDGGNVEIAAARLLALWSIDAEPKMREDLSVRLMAAPGGAKAFGKIVATNKFVRNRVIAEIALLSTPLTYMTFLRAAAGNGDEAFCRLLRSQAKALKPQDKKMVDSQGDVMECGSNKI